MSGFNAADGPLHTHRDVPIRTVYGSTASYILAFSERLELAEAVEKVGFQLKVQNLLPTELCSALSTRTDRQAHAKTCPDDAFGH